MGKHGVKVVWTSIFGWQSSLFSANHATLKEAWEAAMSLAVFHGWTPPRWWHFWRRNDTRPPGSIDISKLKPPKFEPDSVHRQHYAGRNCE